MPRFNPRETDFARATQEVSHGVLAAARQWFESDTVPEAKRIHELRKCIKQLRALLNLMGHAFDVYERTRVGDQLRRAAHLLAPMRDDHVLREAFDNTVRRMRSVPTEGQREALIRALFAQAPAEVAAPASLRDAFEILQTTEISAQFFAVNKRGLDSVLVGFENTYRTAKQALRQASVSGKARHFHRFRTHAKQHRYHLSLFEAGFKGPLRAQGEELARLGEQLGEHHDLHNLKQLVQRASAPTEFTDGLLRTVSRRMRRLESQALTLGGQCTAERVSALSARIRVYFEGSSRP
jgi:CHAD domain-containing protein